MINITARFLLCFCNPLLDSYHWILVPFFLCRAFVIFIYVTDLQILRWHTKRLHLMTMRFSFKVSQQIDTYKSAMLTKVVFGKTWRFSSQHSSKIIEGLWRRTRNVEKWVCELFFETAKCRASSIIIFMISIYQKLRLSNIYEKQALVKAHHYLANLSLVDDDEIFKICLEYWNILVCHCRLPCLVWSSWLRVQQAADLYHEAPVMNRGNGPLMLTSGTMGDGSAETGRRGLYGPILTKVGHYVTYVDNLLDYFSELRIDENDLRSAVQLYRGWPNQKKCWL